MGAGELARAPMKSCFSVVQVVFITKGLGEKQRCAASLGDGRFRAVLADADESYVGREHKFLFAGFDLAPMDIHVVGDRGAPFVLPLGIEAQHRLGMHALLEFDFAHSDSDEMKRRIVLAHGDPRHFVHPHQHLPAEEETVVIHVPRHHEFIRSHGYLLCFRHAAIYSRRRRRMGDRSVHAGLVTTIGTS